MDYAKSQEQKGGFFDSFLDIFTSFNLGFLGSFIGQKILDLGLFLTEGLITRSGEVLGLLDKKDDEARG